MVCAVFLVHQHVAGHDWLAPILAQATCSLRIRAAAAWTDRERTLDL